MGRLGEFAPGEAAPIAGIYELLNIFGSPTGLRAEVMDRGSPLPPAANGQTWRLIQSREGNESWRRLSG